VRAGRDPRPAGSVVHLLPKLDVRFDFPGRFAPALLVRLHTH
jgi:hypothetical protein